MELGTILSKMVETRQDIQELAKEIETKSRRLDVLIDELIEYLKHRRVVETRRAK